jgi:hypothetical protein
MNITLIADKVSQDAVQSLLEQRYPPKRLVFVGDKPANFDEKEKVGDMLHGVIGGLSGVWYEGVETDKYTIYNRIFEAFHADTDVFGLATKAWKPNKLARLTAKLAEYPQIGVAYNDSKNEYRAPYHIVTTMRENPDLGDTCIAKKALEKAGLFGPDMYMRFANSAFILYHIPEILDGV